MRDWLNFQLDDLLLFSPEAYWRLFEMLNTSVWPFQIAFLVVAVLLLFAARQRWRWAGPWAAIALALGWALSGQGFVAEWYQPINWAIVYLLPLFWVQSLLSIALARKVVFMRDGWRCNLALGLGLSALFYPIVAIATGRPLIQAEVVGVAPDPTALMTLAVLGMARPGWAIWVLMLVPVIWLVTSLLTLYAMGASEAWILGGLLAAALIGVCVRRAPARAQI